MTDVFVSYSHDDKDRVETFVEALRSHDVDVWWDAKLRGAEDWRPQLEQQLDTTRCVVVVWSETSTGSDGGFVRDEAARGQRRNVLVPVLMDSVEIPLGFGELQALDLVDWNERASDERVLDIVDAIRAKLDGLPAPSPRRRRRRRRRVVLGASTLVLFTLLWGFGDNWLGVQDGFCTVGLAQPGLSDWCGSWGLGGRPTEDERVAWEALDLRSCAALRDHVQNWPDGAYSSRAADLLASRVTWEDVRWEPASHVLDAYVSSSGTPGASEEDARSLAQRRGDEEAQKKCRAFAASGVFRFESASFVSADLDCRSNHDGHRCSGSGEARCELQKQVKVPRESCAPREL